MPRMVRAAPLRRRGDEAARVTNAELFFDLVYVFAITQLSELLATNLTWRGAGQTLVLLLAVWWAWIYTAWITNWFDPDKPTVRLMLLATMLVSLVMSVALPEAFGPRGLMFAASFVAIQVGRSAWAVLALPRGSGLRRNFERILAWSAAGGVFWVAGAFVQGAARDLVWLAAVIVEYAAPASGFVTPGLGRSTTLDWDISGAHLAERCHAFILIALGESVVVIGATLSGLRITGATAAAFVLSFAGAVALWWLYFDRTAASSSRAIAASADPGRLARLAYTYLQLPMVAGIVVSAVADRLVIAEPGARVAAAGIATILGGAALFLAGHAVFKYAVFRIVSAPRIAGVCALAALVPVGLAASTLVLAVFGTAVVVAVAVWDALTDPPSVSSTGRAIGYEGSSSTP